MKFFVYVLKNKIDSTRYIGQTHNLHIRLKQHNDCKVKSTKSKSPWFIAYYEKYSTRQDAINRELYLKSGIGRDWFDNKLSSLFRWFPACRQAGTPVPSTLMKFFVYVLKNKIDST
ncbi:MAG: GIY-YIG nuclease family protein, partial [Planctomycetota bacterium]|nr:GIY-YIG nuclease family protein [Planctomycetota bacterium]